MKIDYSYAKSRKWEGIKFLPFEIAEPPKEYSKDKVPPLNKNGGFTNFDDEKITHSLPSDKPSHIGFSNISIFPQSFL